MKELNCDQVVSEFVDLLSSKGALKPYMAYVAEYHYVPCDPNAESFSDSLKAFRAWLFKECAGQRYGYIAEWPSFHILWPSTKEGIHFWDAVADAWYDYFQSTYPPKEYEPEEERR
jgi:hypothetical protein|nr:MAG TPA: hypothetical protein [Caudoviricetes sp.]